MASGGQLPDDLVQVGFVSGAYGITGGIRVRPFSDDADALLHAKTWWLDKPGLHEVSVRRAKLHGGDVVTQLGDLADRDLAEALKGAGVYIPRSQFPVLEDDEFYWSDLIGLAVENLQGESLGTVVARAPDSICGAVHHQGGQGSEKDHRRLGPGLLIREAYAIRCSDAVP
jgi:16S rRNA processing protein RimM